MFTFGANSCVLKAARLGWWCALLLVAAGELSQLHASDALTQRIEKFLASERYRTAHVGLLFVDLQSGETVYAQQAEKLFAPASTTKLYTVAAALDALGADYRFETKVYAQGPIKSGVLDGQLILRASGDLTMGGRTTPQGEIEFTSGDHTYASGGAETVLTPADPLAGLNDLAKQVAASGIQKITGDVLIDDWLFDDAESSGSGPARVTPILINDNAIDFTFAPGKAGEPAEVTWRPQCSTLQVELNVATVAASEKLETAVSEIAPGRLRVTGKIPLGQKPVVRIYAVPEPRKFARQLFIEALQRAGVKLSATLEQGSDFQSRAKLPDYDQLQTVATLRSPPFAENARLIMKVSHNLHASTLPLLVAAKHGKRTLGDGLKLERAFFEKAGLPADDISFGGGAGGARADYVTPAATVALLRYMATRSDFPAYERTLPIMGIDGTLSKTVAASSIARGKVQAKTGTLMWTNGLDDTNLLTSKALAGYITTAQDRRLAFAMFINGVPLRHGITPASIGADLGKLCEIVIEER
ncbi:MAG TPA: D-alanyl-D-alanine carboxypeptidase/D-alanyl-D-alanine-endopeptidase [Pirellulaceae bacterium]|nr:D-alanyl-D-alanine carboxypeptidase/D-alanyl-D-alanine-endopeptidase [Pirellulaceae bacterium]